MERVLKKWKEKHVPREDSRKLIISTLRAVASVCKEIHGSGLVHCDIAERNILITDSNIHIFFNNTCLKCNSKKIDWEIVLADWGAVHDPNVETTKEYNLFVMGNYSDSREPSADIRSIGMVIKNILLTCNDESLNREFSDIVIKMTGTKETRLSAHEVLSYLDHQIMKRNESSQPVDTLADDKTDFLVPFLVVIGIVAAIGIGKRVYNEIREQKKQ